MPIFEYKCKKCGAVFEFLVRGNSPKPSCPKCKSKSLEKLVSGFSVNSPKTGGGTRRQIRPRQICGDCSSGGCCSPGGCCCGGCR